MASPVTIASSVGASMSAATGRTGQGHLCYAANQGAWWLFYLSSTASLSALYSTNFASWSAPTGSPFSLAFAHNSEGRNYGFAYANVASNDVLHMNACQSGQSIMHSRFLLGTTWTNSNVEAAVGALQPWALAGNATGLSSAAIPYDIYSSSAGYHANNGSNADTGISWSAGFGSANTPYTGQLATTSESGTIVSIGGGNMMLLTDNSSTAHNFTQLYYETSSSGTWTTSNSNSILASTVTGTSCNNWGAVGLTTSDIHVVALSDNSSNYVHRRFNGSTWSTGDSIPTLAYGTLSGILLAADGTNVWAHAIDSSGNVQQSKWTSGSGWSAWSNVCAFVANARSYLSGYQVVSGSTIGLVWTEANGGNFDIVGTLITLGPVLSTANDGPPYPMYADGPTKQIVMGM